MKKLIFIGGTMGVGKSTVANKLNQALEDSIYLDGDWCWYMHPWQFNEENKQMVLRNIQYLLQSYIDNSNFKHIIFCWVMDEQETIDLILSQLNLANVEFVSISLMANEETLRKNIEKDVARGIRDENMIVESINRITKYTKVDSSKIDTSNNTIQETVNQIKTSLK
ncbi:AAA family ATPase [Enterococcus saccharolyticus]|uniref:AAA family ATPase n=2 Tax=Enterococcus TaxID=1350 RepID=UPI001E627088|nr:AAA family ATPase [Enterococcus saccharolyticus]MCD5003407.1 AAA family ATPase [Enterococcus saccharolyticus]